MLQNILKSKGAIVLHKNEQKQINGGLSPICPLPKPGDTCYSGPFFCNTFGLPICNLIDLED
ncbi:hypothetical protein [Aquimarina litoralis]|uniref:hypothetical protein n=1 Tax=Aquimarina litoralis TaxID=584605 RepID=UPI001C55D8F6|nr:hypothetical protein [Aquimarina litoralis]MBW1298851.1 hypothetical protein [Aquimarina litoralis]